jgi:hypothetical protein
VRHPINTGRAIGDMASTTYTNFRNDGQGIAGAALQTAMAGGASVLGGSGFLNGYDAARRGDVEGAAEGFTEGGIQAALAATAVKKGLDSCAFKPTQLKRPYIRQSVRTQIEANAPKTPTGEYIDPNTLQPIEGPYDLGHKYGQEFWRLREKAQAEGLTQEEFNELLNDPDFYQVEDPASNRSHEFEKPR